MDHDQFKHAQQAQGEPSDHDLKAFLRDGLSLPESQKNELLEVPSSLDTQVTERGRGFEQLDEVDWNRPGILAVAALALISVCFYAVMISMSGKEDPTFANGERPIDGRAINEGSDLDSSDMPKLIHQDSTSELEQSLEQIKTDAWTLAMDEMVNHRNSQSQARQLNQGDDSMDAMEQVFMELAASNSNAAEDALRRVHHERKPKSSSDPEVALALLMVADIRNEEAGEREFAAENYRLVRELYPSTEWADVATQRLAALGL